MAIFGNQHDIENVPLLSQLAQVDRENADELRAVAALFFPPVDEAALPLLAELCGIVFDTLHGLATARAVPGRCLEWINENESSKLFRFDIADGAEGYLDGDTVSLHKTELIPLAALEYLPYRIQAEKKMQAVVHDRLSQLMQAALQNAAKNKPVGVKLCPECGNPFVAVKPSQIYCSHRDAHTAGSRRRREEKE